MVQHPFIRFDPTSASVRTSETLEGRNAVDVITGEDNYCAEDECNRTLVLHEAFELELPLGEFAIELPRALEDEWRMPKDRFLWEDTGAWTVDSERGRHIGLGPATLRSALQRRDLVTGAYVLVATSSILAALWERGAPDRLAVETCLGNRFFSFAEEAAAIDAALAMLGPRRRVLSQIEDWEDLHRPPPEEAQKSALERADHDQSPFRLSPIAVVKTRLPKHIQGPQFDYAVFPRPDTEIPFRSLREQDFVLGQLRGHKWMNDDFDEQFIVSGTEVLFLNSLMIVSWTFDFWEEDSLPF